MSSGYSVAAKMLGRKHNSILGQSSSSIILPSPVVKRLPHLILTLHKEYWNARLEKSYRGK